MKTLVYFASGKFKAKYQTLDFDKIYLIDNCFKDRRKYNKNIFSKGKITCVGMDCLESIAFLKQENVKIDYFVSLNEGLFEGGGFYAINSDFFLGYVMPLLNHHYIHIMDKTYYYDLQMYHVTMDLPYDTIEIDENDDRYLNPRIFSGGRNAKVLQMSKLMTSDTEISLNPRIKIKIIHDSIWNYYEELESIVISFARQGQGEFFNTIRFPKVLNLNEMKVTEVLDFCENNRIQKIGFTPWGGGHYKGFIGMLKERKSDYPNEVSLFHLNKNDYQEMKLWKNA